MSQSQDPQPIHTAGGAAITGDVNTGGGDFVGRDFIQHIKEHVTITGDGNIVGDGNAVIQARGNVYLIQIGERVGRLTQQGLQRILTSALAADEPLQVYANPYRGLKPFTTKDADLFFGRDALIAEMVAQLRRAPRFLVVVGPSGSGKSSVVQAGLLPALQRGALSGSQGWQIVTTRPGADPYAAIDLEGLGNSDRSERTVLFLDQFEELFVLCAPDVQQRFLAELHTLITGATPVTVILTLRADFYGHLQRSSLGALLKQALVDVLPLTPAELRATVEEPARQVGLAFEAGLVERIVEDAGQAEHALPLLQSALAQVCHQQEGGILTYAAYQAVGGVAGALGLWAEDAYAALPAEEQILARRILTRLVHYGEEARGDSRQRLHLSELAAETDAAGQVHDLVRRLASARLLVTDSDGATETVEIIHDALLHEWGRLAGWITEQREFYLWRQRLDGQLQAWEAKGCDDGALLRGALLAESEAWAANYSADLNLLESKFIKASLTLREQEQAAREHERIEKEQRRRRLTLATVGAAVAFLVLALLAWGQRNVALDAQVAAEQQAQISLSRQLAAQAQQLESLGTEQDTILAKLLAVESLHRYPEYTANHVLREGFKENPRKVWEITTDQIMTSALDPQGKRLAIGGCVTYGSQRCFIGINDGFLMVLDVRMGRTLYESRDIDGSIDNVTFSPNGDRLAFSIRHDSGSNIILWDLTSYTESLRIVTENVVTCLDFSPDAGWLISQEANSASDASMTRIWNLKTGEVILGLVGEDAARHLDDNQWALGFAGGERSVLWASSPVDEKLIIGSMRGTIDIWEIGNQHKLLEIANNGPISVISVSPDGQWFAAGGEDGVVRVWRFSDGREITRVQHKDHVNLIQFNSTDSELVSGSINGQVQILELDTNEVYSYSLGARINQIVFRGSEILGISASPCDVMTCGNRCYCLETSLGVWNVKAEHEFIKIMSQSGFIEFIALAPDSERLVFVQTYSVTSWDVASVEFVKQAFDRRAKAPDNDSSQVQKGQLHIDDGETYYELHTGENTWTVSGYCEARVNIGASSFCSYASARFQSNGGDIAVIPLDLKLDYDPTMEILYSLDANSVLVRGIREVRILNLREEREVLKIRYNAELYSAHFSSDGKSLVTAGCHNEAIHYCTASSVQVWDLSTGDEISRMNYNGEVTAYFTSGGQRIVSIGCNGYEVISENPFSESQVDCRKWGAFSWLWKTADLIDWTCITLTRNLTREEWNQYIGPEEPYRATCPNLPISEE